MSIYNNWNLFPYLIARKKCVAVMVMALFFALDMHAKNDFYEIDDRLLPIYEEAYEKRRTTEGLALAGRMYDMAVSFGDKKAQCLALTIPFLYWHLNGTDDAEYEKALKRLQDKAVETGYMQYYFYGCTNKVNYLLFRNKSYTALTYVKDVQQTAFDRNDQYGIYITMAAIGKIQEKRGEYMTALKSFLSALEYAQKHLSEQDLVSTYLKVSDCYKNIGDYAKQLEYVERGLAATQLERNRKLLLQQKADALFRLGREKEFLETLRQFDFDNAINSKNITTLLVDLKFMKLIVEKKWAEAEEFIGSGNKSIKELQRYVLLYYKKGEMKKAYEYLLKCNILRDSLNQSIMIQDMGEISLKLNNGLIQITQQKIALQNTALELANAQLTLRNSALDLERSKASERMMRLDAENNLLNLNNKQLEASSLRDSLEQQKAMQREKEIEIRSGQIISWIIVGLVVIVTLISIMYIYNRMMLSRKLKLANDMLHNNVTELENARDEAQQANRMKTMFIQNMSHEIRTPLNAIVGFSQLLAGGGDMFGKAERKDMSNRISEGSDLLLTIINDILDLTMLEGDGKYQMKIGEVVVNDVCRNSIDTVMHRKAENVVMRFESDLPDDYKIHTDGNRVKQVLINFLTNAAKNTTEGEIVLSVWSNKVPGRLQLAVTDTGIGIPRDKMDEIFERFKKLDSFKQGTGLGLNICQAIADRLNARVFIDKEYTTGARFIFELNND